MSRINRKFPFPVKCSRQIYKITFVSESNMQLFGRPRKVPSVLLSSVAMFTCSDVQTSWASVRKTGMPRLMSVYCAKLGHAKPNLIRMSIKYLF